MSAGEFDEPLERGNRRTESGRRGPYCGPQYSRGSQRGIKVRYEQTLLAEYPKLKRYLAKLRGAKAEHKRATLAQIWDLDEGEAGRIADELVEAGFFVRGGTVHDPEYWIPLLYRDALGLIRGGAFKPDSASRSEGDEGNIDSRSTP